MQRDASGGLGVGRRQLGRHNLQLLALAPDQRQARAQAGQLVRGAAAQATATAGDDDGLALEETGPKHRAVALGVGR
ncbi:hypothetical protein D9M68_873190 [compost metagenome]